MMEKVEAGEEVNEDDLINAAKNEGWVDDSVADFPPHGWMMKEMDIRN